MWKLIVGVILGFLIYYKIYKKTTFWAERNITHLPSWPLMGNLGEIFTGKKHFLEITNDIYKNFSNDRCVDYVQFTTPVLMLRDLHLIKQIGVKEFDSFHDHLTQPKLDPLLSLSLINLSGEQWKQMKASLSPAFTSSKMRNMYHLMGECSQNFVKHFEGKEQADIEMKELLARFTNDVIASTAFGIQINSVEECDHEFYKTGKKSTEFGFLPGLKLCFILMAPNLAGMLKLKMLCEEVATFFRTIITNNITSRIKDHTIRPYLIHLLLEARQGSLKHENADNRKNEGFTTAEESHIGKNTTRIELTDGHIVAQALLFFFAGFETVSTAATLMAYKLAANLDIQKKLQEEIDTIGEKYISEIPYDALLSMKYLNQVVCESLRKWPAGFQTDRQCYRDYIIFPESVKEKRFVIEKGMVVIIPIMAIHRDPQYFPDPEALPS